MATWHELYHITILKVTKGENLLFKSLPDFIITNDGQVTAGLISFYEEVGKNLKAIEDFFILRPRYETCFGTEINLYGLLQDYPTQLRALWTSEDDEYELSKEYTLVLKVSDSSVDIYHDELEVEWIGVLDYDKIENAMVKI